MGNLLVGVEAHLRFARRSPKLATLHHIHDGLELPFDHQSSGDFMRKAAVQDGLPIPSVFRCVFEDYQRFWRAQTRKPSGGSHLDLKAERSGTLQIFAISGVRFDCSQTVLGAV